MDEVGVPGRATPRRTTVRTLPEQIADDIGAAITRGEYTGGERLLEQDIATRYGVSRGPVREALRLLTQRGLAVLYPRRGAFVVEVSLNSLVDLFNTRAVLVGLAARYFANMASDDARGKLAHVLQRLTTVCAMPDTDSVSFVRVTSQISFLISRYCGSESLGRLIDHQNDGSAWGSLWQSGRIDFATRERRLTATADYLRMGGAIEARDGAEAEAIMRLMVMNSRESAVAVLAKNRGDTYDVRRLLTA
jgi:DNA-binding GntR family transcriptional regulator